MSGENSIPAAADTPIGVETSLPPPGPEHSAADIGKHIEHVLRQRARLQVQMEELRYTLEWLKTLHQRAVHKQLHTTYGTEEIEIDAGIQREPKHDNMADDSITTSQASATETERIAGKGEGRGSGLGRGRRGIRRPTKPDVKAPKTWCQACWNEKRNLKSGVRHTHGLDGTACRLSRGEMHQKWVQQKNIPIAILLDNTASCSNPGVLATSAGDGVSASIAAGSDASPSRVDAPATGLGSNASDSHANMHESVGVVASSEAPDAQDLS